MRLRHGERRGAVVDAEPDRVRQLREQRQQETARARAEVEDAQRRRPVADLVERRLDHGLGLGPRDQDRRTDLEAQAPELLRAQDVGDRLARSPAPHQGFERRFLFGAERRRRARHQGRALDSGRGGKEEPGLAARVLDAGGGKARGKLSHSFA